MKRLTASEARRRWFSVLDRVARGEVIAIERGGRLIVLRREDPPSKDAVTPDYTDVLQVPNAEKADQWHWDWSPGGRGMRIRKRTD